MQELITHQQVYVEQLLWYFNYLIWIYLGVPNYGTQKWNRTLKMSGKFLMDAEVTSLEDLKYGSSRTFAVVVCNRCLVE